MVAGLADVEDGIIVGSLSAGRQHSGYTTFEGGNLGCYGIVGGVLQAGIEISAVFQVEEAGHLFTCLIFEGCTLVDGEYAGFSFLGRPAGLYTQGFGFESLGHNQIFV